MATSLSIDHNQAIGTTATMRASDNSTKAAGGSILTGFGDDWQQHYYQCTSSIVSDTTMLGLDRALAALTPASSIGINGSQRSENVAAGFSIPANVERWIVFEMKVPQIGANPGHQGPFQMKTSGAPDAGSPVMGISFDSSSMYLTDASNDEHHSLGAPPRTTWSVFAIGMYVTTSTADAWVKCYRRDTGQSVGSVVMAKETWNSRRTTTGGSSLTNNLVTGTMFPEGSTNYIKFGVYRTTTTASACETRYGKLRVFSTEAEAVSFMNAGTAPPTLTPPTGDFTWSPGSPTTGTVTTFTAAATPASGKTITGYAWTSDGNSFGSGAATATITYVNPATKNVQCVVSQSDGATLSISHAVTVTAGVVAAPPTLSWVFSPASPVAGVDLVTLTATATPAGGQSITGYSWNFDGAAIQTGNPTTITFANPGTKTVTATVTQTDGQTATLTKTITVLAAPSAPPAAAFSAPSTGVTGGSAVVDASASTPATGQTITGYSWNVNGTDVAVGRTATISFPSAGTYTVKLVVTQSDGQTAQSVRQIVVSTVAAVTPVTISMRDPEQGGTITAFWEASTDTGLASAPYQVVTRTSDSQLWNIYATVATTELQVTGVPGSSQVAVVVVAADGRMSDYSNVLAIPADMTKLATRPPERGSGTVTLFWIPPDPAQAVDEIHIYKYVAPASDYPRDDTGHLDQDQAIYKGQGTVNPDDTTEMMWTDTSVTEAPTHYLIVPARQ